MSGIKVSFIARQKVVFIIFPIFVIILLLNFSHIFLHKFVVIIGIWEIQHGETQKRTDAPLGIIFQHGHLFVQEHGYEADADHRVLLELKGMQFLVILFVELRLFYCVVVDFRVLRCFGRVWSWAVIGQV